MGDRRFTLLEIHLDGDAQFGPRSIGGTSSEESEPADVEATSSDRDSQRLSKGSPLRTGLKVLAVVAVVAVGAESVRRLAGRMSKGFPPEIEIEREEPERPAE